LDEKQSLLRRGSAGFEFCAASVGFLQISESNRSLIPRVAHLINVSAELLNPEARASIGHLLEVFDLEKRAWLTPEFEAAYLEGLIRKGNKTARDRLRSTYPPIYSEFVAWSRSRVISNENVYGNWMSQLENASDSERQPLYLNILPTAAILGMAGFYSYLAANQHSNLLSQLLNVPGASLDVASGNGETALYIACQTGNFQAFKVLLGLGATPVFSNLPGLTALHLLGCFNEEDVKNVAQLLVQSGSDLEARCIGSEESSPWFSYKPPAEGTPLSWAVAERNINAVTALVSLGADPFDRACTSAKPSSRQSPVHLAARMHLHEILSFLILSNDQDKELNSCWRAEGQWLNILPLWCAVDYQSTGAFERIMIHGKQHDEACLKTVTLLLKRGALPQQVAKSAFAGPPISAFEAACVHGQPFLIEYMWQREDLRPSADELSLIIQKAIDLDDETTLGILVPHMQELIASLGAGVGFRWKFSLQGGKSPEIIQSLTQSGEMMNSRAEEGFSMVPARDEKFRITIGPDYKKSLRVPAVGEPGLLLKLTFDPEAEDGVIVEDLTTMMSHLGQGSSESGDEIPQRSEFELAILGGYFGRARKIFARGSIDTICRNEVNGSSLLGRLIQKSFRFLSADGQVKFLLDLKPASEEEFNSVLEIDGTTYTALQAAVMLPDLFPDVRKSDVVLEAVISKYFDSKYLNALTGGTRAGLTALHIAVQCGNMLAVKKLSGEPEIDINILNSEGETPMDVAYRRASEAYGVVKVETNDLETALREHYKNTTVITNILHRKGGRNRRFRAFVVRQSEEIFHSVDLMSYECLEWELGGKWGLFSWDSADINSYTYVPGDKSQYNI
jgi:ankyrin repeat protein